MLQVKHKGIQVSLPINPADLNLGNGIMYDDLYSDELKKLVGGRAIRINSQGYVELADGAEDGYVGPLVVSATGGHLENKPALASGLVAVAFGQCQATTDQIVTTETFVPGDKIYVGTGANAGLYTKTPATADTQAVGLASSAASASEPNLTILFF